MAELGLCAGSALGVDPAAAVAELVARVLPLVGASAGDELVTTIAGGMRLADYLPTRTFELAVHTAEGAVALGLTPSVPPTAAVRRWLSSPTSPSATASPARCCSSRPGRTGGGFSVL